MLRRIGTTAIRRVTQMNQTKPFVRCLGSAAHGHAAAGHKDAHGHDDGHHGAHDAHHDDHHDDHGHDHHGPHIPEGYEKAGKFCLVTAYLWVFYKLKEDKGQLFGLYQPWLHEHEHTHYHYVQEEEFGTPKLHVEHEEEEDEEDEGEFAGI
jgi:hypothetical protein